MYSCVLKPAEGLRRVCEDKKFWFHILSDGNPAYARRFKWAADFSNGLAAVEDGNGCYHIRPDGTPAYERRFDWVSSFINVPYKFIPPGESRTISVDEIHAFAIKGSQIFCIKTNGETIHSYSG